MTRVVAGYLGDEASLNAIREWAARAEVIVVALDLDGRVSLTELHDAALAAGATRCHALDVREELVRDALVPALRARVFADPFDAFTVVAQSLVARKLSELGEMERATLVLPAPSPVARSIPPAAPLAPRLSIGFDNGVPISVNGVPMPLTELMDSVETITGESALAVLHREYASLS